MSKKLKIDPLPNTRMMHLGARGLVDVHGFRHHESYKEYKPLHDETIEVRQWLLDHVGHSGRDWMAETFQLTDVIYYIFSPQDAFLFKMRWC